MLLYDSSGKSLDRLMYEKAEVLSGFSIYAESGRFIPWIATLHFLDNPLFAFLVAYIGAPCR